MPRAKGIGMRWPKNMVVIVDAAALEAVDGDLPSTAPLLYMAVLLCCCEAAARLPPPHASPLAMPVGGSGAGGQDGAQTGSRGRGGRPSSHAGGVSGCGPAAARCDCARRTCARTLGCRCSCRGCAAEVRGWVVLSGRRRVTGG